jgi:hypothetical protein
MLKIETTKWLGKCPRHPFFDPEKDGIGAIKGGCPHCLELQAIFENHQRTLKLMSAFAPIHAQHRNQATPSSDLQGNLFATK